MGKRDSGIRRALGSDMILVIREESGGDGVYVAACLHYGLVHRLVRPSALRSFLIGGA